MPTKSSYDERDTPFLLKSKIEELRKAFISSGLTDVSDRVAEEQRIFKKHEKDERHLVEQIRSCYSRNMKKLSSYYEKKIHDISEKHRKDVRRLDALHERIDRGELVDREEYEMLKRENKKLEIKVLDLQRKVETLQVENTELADNLSDAKLERKYYKNECKSATGEMLGFKDRLKCRNQELKDLKKQVEEMQRQVEETEKAQQAAASATDHHHNDHHHNDHGLSIVPTVSSSSKNPNEFTIKIRLQAPNY